MEGRLGWPRAGRARVILRGNLAGAIIKLCSFCWCG